MGACQSYLFLHSQEKEFWGQCAHLLCWAQLQAHPLLGCTGIQNGPCLSDQHWLLLIFPSRRKCFLPVCLKKSQPIKQWENPGSTMDLEAFFLKGGFSLSPETLEMAVFLLRGVWLLTRSGSRNDSLSIMNTQLSKGQGNTWNLQRRIRKCIF